MRKNPWIAGLLSLVFLGLGHVYVGKKALGAALMIAFIVIGNLNALWLSAYALTNASQIAARHFCNLRCCSLDLGDC
jgi:hypothetical protein